MNDCAQLCISEPKPCMCGLADETHSQIMENKCDVYFQTLVNYIVYIEFSTSGIVLTT